MRPIFRLLTEFPGVGGLHHSINIRVCSYLQLLKSWDYATVVIGFVITAFFLYYLVEEFIEFDKMGLSYFWSIWSILDIIVIALALAFVILHIVRYMLVEKTMLEVKTAYESHRVTFVDFEYLSYVHVCVRNTGGYLAFFAMIKIFKYLSFNKAMMQLNDTMYRASGDLTNFAFMFVIVLYAFAQLGYSLFGDDIDVYNNPAKTITTLLRIMLGDFDYSKLRARDPIIGPTFFFCYIFFIYFILINMFLAIINQTYMAVKEDLTQKRDDFDVSEYLKKQFMRVVKKLTFKGFRKKKRAKQIIVNDKVLRRKALDELTRWETDLLNRGYTEDEVYAVFGDYYAVAQIDTTTGTGDLDVAKLAQLENRTAQIEHSLKAIQGHFENALNKLDMMERAKLNRSKKMDAIFDNLSD